MLAHLLDGDVASNHLSWQWVAGTGSSKPYLFNADNVAKYAPEPWHSPGTVIDTSYEALDRIARSSTAVNPRIDHRRAGEGFAQPDWMVTPPDERWQSAVPTTVADRDVWLLHPWSIGSEPQGVGADVLLIGVGISECHVQMPWNARRWSFATEGLLTRTPHLWWGSALQLARALQGARSVRWQPDRHADAGLQSLRALLRVGDAQPMVATPEQPRLFEPVEQYCESFSQWWRHTRIAL
jgi:deoxyribodipyrimidine photo-lyase